MLKIRLLFKNGQDILSALKSGQEGTVLVMVLLVILLFSVFISSLALVLLTDIRMSSYNYRQRQAALNAESALVTARFMIETATAEGEEIYIPEIRNISGSFCDRGSYEISQVSQVSSGEGDNQVVYYQLQALGQYQQVQTVITDRYYLQF